MLQPRQGLNFALEQTLGALPGERTAANDFQCYAAAGTLLLGFVDDTHAAFADFAHDPVVLERDGSFDRNGREIERIRGLVLEAGTMARICLCERDSVPRS